MGIWAIKHLARAAVALAFAYLVGAVLAGVTGYLGGPLVGPDRPAAADPDRLGLPGARAAAAARASATSVCRGLVLLALLPAFGSLGGAADQAMVADLVAPERQEARLRVGARRVEPRRHDRARRSAACC